jgi:hypothetical protein
LRIDFHHPYFAPRAEQPNLVYATTATLDRLSFDSLRPVTVLSHLHSLIERDALLRRSVLTLRSTIDELLGLAQGTQRRYRGENN